MRFDELANPYALLLALLVPVYVWRLMRPGKTAAVRYPSMRNLKRLPKSFRQRCRVLPPLLRGAAMLLLVLIMARPLRQIETQELPSEGIAIVMLLDRSSSMSDTSEKMMFRGNLKLRFEVARRVAIEFIEGDGKALEGRPNDLIGLTTFAKYPETNYPFTLFHHSLVDGLSRMAPMKPMLTSIGKQTDDQRQAAIVRDSYGRRMYRRNPLDGTELAEAIAYGANQLISLGDDLSRSGGEVLKYNVKSKIMVLLTDGLTQRNFADPETVNKLKEEDIKVYVVQILSSRRFRERPDGTIEVIVPDNTRRRNDIFSLFGGNARAQQARQIEATVNEAINRSRRLARKTGGTHFLATTGDELHEVYAQIDAMEQSDVGRRTVYSREEVFRPYLLSALALLVGEVVLGLTWLRRVP